MNETLLNYQTSHLPKGWVLTSLGEVIISIRQKVMPDKFPHLQYIGMEHIEAHTMKLLGSVSASTMRSQAVHFFPHDVFYGRLRPYLNKVYCPEFEGLCSSEFIVFSASKNLSSKFLKYFLNRLEFVSFASRLNEGDRPRVDFSQISVFPFALPPLAEQERIVLKIEELFTKLEAGVAELKQAQAQLKRYRQGVLKSAVTGELTREWREANQTEPAEILLKKILKERREKWEADQLKKFAETGKMPKNDDWKKKYREPASPEIENPFEIPEGWTWAVFEQLTINSSNGLSKRSSNIGEPHIVLRLADIFEGEISIENSRKIKLLGSEVEKYQLKQQDLICIRVNGSVNLVGRLIRNKSSEIITFCDHFIRFEIAHSTVLKNYLWLFFKTQDVRKFIELNMVSSAGQNTVSQTTMNSVFVSLPPLAEQEKIVEEVERLLSVADAVEKTIEGSLRQSERLRQSILQKAFTGKLVPQDERDEPASILLERITKERKVKAGIGQAQNKKNKKIKLDDKSALQANLPY